MSISYAISVDAAADNSSHVSSLYSSFHSQVTLLLCGVKNKARIILLVDLLDFSFIFRVGGGGGQKKIK